MATQIKRKHQQKQQGEYVPYVDDKGRLWAGDYLFAFDKYGGLSVGHFVEDKEAPNGVKLQVFGLSRSEILEAQYRWRP